MCIFWPCNLLFHLSTSHMPGDPYSPVCRVTPFYISGLFNIMLCSCGQSYTHCILYHQNKKTWKSGEMTRTRSNWIQELENLIFAFFFACYCILAKTVYVCDFLKYLIKQNEKLLFASEEKYFHRKVDVKYLRNGSLVKKNRPHCLPY